VGPSTKDNITIIFRKKIVKHHGCLTAAMTSLTQSFTLDMGGMGESCDCNPQAAISVKIATKLSIKMHAPGVKNVQFFVHKSTTPQRLFEFPDDESRILKSPFYGGTDTEATLDAEGGATYIVLMMTEVPAESEVTLSIESDDGPDSFDLVPLPLIIRSTKLQFQEAYSGGANTGPHTPNPQFFLSIKQPTGMSILMEAPGAGAVRFWVLEVKEDSARVEDADQFDGALCLFESKFLGGDSVSASCQYVPSGNYIVLVNSKAKIGGEVTLTVTSSGAEGDISLTGENYTPPPFKTPCSFSDELIAKPRVELVEIYGTLRCEGLLYETVADARAVVDAIIAECTQKPDLHFQDPDFMPCPDSIQQSGKEYNMYQDKSDVEGPWKTVRELSVHPMLFKGIDPDDINQGALGDCWMLACFASLATRPHLIENLFYPKEYSAAGIYAVSVCTNGTWRAIIIDDSLPVGNNGSLKYGHSRSQSEFWVSLLEKAMAKVRSSSYPRLSHHQAVCVCMCVFGEKGRE